VDKAPPWERPKPCAEAVGGLGFAEAVDIRPEWIRHTISKAAFHAPGGASVTYTDRNKGYIIERAGMQRDLADECAERGVSCDFQRRVSDVTSLAGGYRTVRFADGQVTKARVVIDAAGVSSPFGKQEGISWEAYDREAAYFALAENVEHTPDTVHLYVSSELAPGGYAWMFPSRGERVNIGVLVGRKHRADVNIRSLLETFMARHFPGAKVCGYQAGMIACGYRRTTIAANGLIKAGDAANTTNPISRAGIVEAMVCGGLAGEYAVMMLEARSPAAINRLCSRYEHAWHKRMGRRHEKLAASKESLAAVPDTDYDAAATALAAIAPGKITMARIFGTALRRFPRLVWALRHLM
jgi:digeranylgeranylglycerophospholipid reductase